MKKIVGGILSLFFLGSPAAFAENDQTVVIGLNVGTHSFSNGDDLRKGIFDDINVAGASDLYVEWYLLEEFGIGLRVNSFAVTEKIATYYDDFDREFAISNTFVTLNWVPIGGTEYTRFGVVAGLGNSDYKYTIKRNGYTVVSDSSDGPAVLLGGYVDWGAEDFGARFALNSVSTDLAKLSGYKVDASGVYWTIGIRWAFR